MNTLIIYGSQYGTTKRYAEKFAEMTDVPIISFEDIENLEKYERVVYFGALYAGGVKGLKNTIKKLSPNTKLVIVTVGLADVCDEENISNIRSSIRKQVPEYLFKKVSIFHLRGGIDYQKLSLKHSLMMALLYNKAKNMPEEKKTAEVRAMIETFNSKVDFVDFACLDQITESIC